MDDETKKKKSQTIKFDYDDDHHHPSITHHYHQFFSNYFQITLRCKTNLEFKIECDKKKISEIFLGLKFYILKIPFGVCFISVNVSVCVEDDQMIAMPVGRSIARTRLCSSIKRQSSHSIFFHFLLLRFFCIE